MTDPAETARALAAFLRAAEPMKWHTRTAWSSSGRQESVAEHSWRLSLLVLLAAPHFPGLDAARMVGIALVHDLGEAVHGDISAPLQNEDDGKERMEEETVTALAAILDGGDGMRLEALWREYQEGRTPEAQLVKALDKIETILQHNEGANPPDFDYAFNLDYGSQLPHEQPLLAALRKLADEETRARARAQRGSPGTPGDSEPVPEDD
jgi:putative hydrolase of HD superfamily